MIVSQTSKRPNSRRLHAGVLLCAVVLLPLGLARAQNCDAVERRLGLAVSHGELSLKQAAVMMDALRRVAKDARDGEGDIKNRFGKWLGDVGQKLKAAVEAGKLSEEDAWKKWRHFKEKELAPKLKAAVKAGEMSEAQTKALWHDVEMAEVGERLKAAVAKGEITNKQALAKWAEINKKGDRDGQRKRITREDLDRAAIKIRKAVAAGKITPEQARAKMQAMRKMMAGQGHQDERVAKYRAIAAEIRAAVKAGKLSEKDAEKKLIAIRKRLFADR